MEELEPKVHTLAQGAGITILGKIFGRGLNFVAQVLLARTLGADLFGLYAIGWSILRMISLIGPLGLDHGIIRFGSIHSQENKGKLRSTFTVALGLATISGLVVSIGLYFSSSWFSLHIFHKNGLELVLKTLAISVPFVIGLRVLASFSTVTKSMQYLIISEELSQPSFDIILILCVIALGLGLKGVLWATIASFALAFSLAGFFVIKLFPSMFQAQISEFTLVSKEIIRFSIPVGFTALISSLLSWVDRLLVGGLLSESETGIYATVSLISVLFVTILSGIKVIFVPMIAELFNNQDIKGIEDIYRVSTKWGLYLSIPFALVLFLYGKEFLTAVFGPAYALGYSALIVLVAAQLINIGTGAFDSLFIMTGNNRSWFRISALGLLCNIILCIVLIPRFGVLGASIGTGLTMAGISIVALFQIKKKLNVWPYDERFIKSMIASGATLVTLFSLKALPIPENILSLMLIFIGSYLVFVVVLFILHFDHEDLEVFSMIKRRIHSYKSL